jgi:hypothetical protein
MQATLVDSLYELAGELVISSNAIRLFTSACQLIYHTRDYDFLHKYFLLGPQVRFLLRSGREYDQASSADSDKLSPRFLGYFLFRSAERKQALDKRFMYNLVNFFLFS